MLRTIEEIRSSLQNLDNAVILDLLANAALKHPEVKFSIQAAIDTKRSEESKRVLNFDGLSKSVWYKINIQYKRLRDSQQYEMAGDVYRDVVDAIERIQKTCGPFASAETRYNGLSVLRKIGKTICLSGDGNTIGREVRDDFGWNSALEDAMLAIAQIMDEEERCGIREDEETGESLWPKLLELKELADDYCIMEGLQGVLDALEEGYHEACYEPSMPSSDSEDYESDEERSSKRKKQSPSLEQVTFQVDLPPS